MRIFAAEDTSQADLLFFSREPMPIQVAAQVLSCAGYHGVHIRLVEDDFPGLPEDEARTIDLPRLRPTARA